ncbi:hypothetical protein HanIR_Chr07g0337271 [Helianthus annuus]|nr:hypothetical protein HanIR_Chr07g0337271 [Helianthus annuus]
MVETMCGFLVPADGYTASFFCSQVVVEMMCGFSADGYTTSFFGSQGMVVVETMCGFSADGYSASFAGAQSMIGYKSVYVCVGCVKKLRV